jgi:hypothetical protein
MSAYSINLKGNSKTGIPTTTSSEDTCPTTCPLYKNGCYASYSFLGNYWKKLGLGGVKNSGDFSWLLAKIKALPVGTLWRHNQAGDLPHSGGIIDADKLAKLTKANDKKLGFTYTHHLPELGNNAQVIKFANLFEFTVNLSANNLEQADHYVNLGIAPVVTLLPIGTEKVSYTPAGNRVVKCPAEYQDITCGDCKLCQRSDRDYIIGFTAHGTGKNKVSKIASNLIEAVNI